MTANAWCTSDSRRANRLRNLRCGLAGEACRDCRSISVRRLLACVFFAGGLARWALRAAAAFVCDRVFLAGAVGGAGTTIRRRDLIRRGRVRAGGITLGATGVEGETVCTLGSGVLCCDCVSDMDRVMRIVLPFISPGVPSGTLGTAGMFTGLLVAERVGVVLLRSCWRSRSSVDGLVL